MRQGKAGARRGREREEGTYGGRALDVLDHELVGLVGGVDARLGADDGERKGVEDDERVAVELALHEPHDLVLPARARVHDLGVDVRVSEGCRTRVVSEEGEDGPS